MSDQVASGFARMGARVKVATTERFAVRIDVLRFGHWEVSFG